MIGSFNDLSLMAIATHLAFWRNIAHRQVGFSAIISCSLLGNRLSYARGSRAAKDLTVVEPEATLGKVPQKQLPSYFYIRKEKVKETSGGKPTIVLATVSCRCKEILPQ